MPPKSPAKRPTAKAAVSAPTGFMLNRMREVLGLLWVLGAAFLLVSLLTYSPQDPSFNVSAPSFFVANKGGLVGAYLSDWLLQYFGLASLMLPLSFVLQGVYWVLYRAEDMPHLKQSALPLLMMTLTVPLAALGGHMLTVTQEGVGNGGLVGFLLLKAFSPLLGLFGALSLSLVVFLGALTWWSGITVKDLYRYTIGLRNGLYHSTVWLRRRIAHARFHEGMQINLPLPLTPSAPAERPQKVKAVVEQSSSQPRKSDRLEAERQAVLPLDLSSDYALPPLSLLDNTTSKFKGESEESLQKNARQIEAQLANFGVKGQVVRICPGPVITIYELEPAAGVKTSAVVNLADDLARAMSAIAIRIAPIPGRTVIGVEIPNAKRQSVSLKELLATELFETDPGKLTVALGVDTTGHPVYADISKMPHALIAGTTGSGKSVAMNAFILSLAYRMTPDELRFVMIDPKMLELSIYNDIPHLLTPVIIDPHKAAGALKWVVKEMENRYRLMSELSVKNLQSFNAKFTEMQAQGKIPLHKVQVGFDALTGQAIYEERPVCSKAMPYIVVVLDELADLMMVAGKEVEQSIARLAQMARAAGIHLLVATQRPSVDVVTGLIKANIPTRMSFNVTSKIDSRTVLDQMGAEQLLGKGDMLYMANGTNGLQRLHGAFVSEDECNRIADHLRAQGKPAYIGDMMKAVESSAGGGEGGNGEDGEGADDPLYNKAVELVSREQKASTSFIQRHLQIGYNRAARMVDRMEAEGLVSAPNHVGKREVVIRSAPEEGY